MATHGRNVRKKRTTVAELEIKFDNTTDLFNVVTKRQSEDIKTLNDNIVALNARINNIVTKNTLRDVIELHSREIGKLNVERQAAKVADFTASCAAQAQMPTSPDTVGSSAVKLLDLVFSAVREGLEVMTGIECYRVNDYAFNVQVNWMVPVTIFVRINHITKRIYVSFNDRGGNIRESTHWHTANAAAKIVAVAMFYARSDR